MKKLLITLAAVLTFAPALQAEDLDEATQAKITAKMTQIQSLADDVGIVKAVKAQNSGATAETAAMISERLEYLTPEDRATLLAHTALPSVVAWFIDRLRFRKAELFATDAATVARRIACESAVFRRGLSEYKSLYRAICKLSAKHWGSIQSILIKPFAHMSAEEKARLPVSPDESVGGAGHERPEAIFRMRKDNAAVQKLLAGLELVE